MFSFLAVSSPSMTAAIDKFIISIVTRIVKEIKYGYANDDPHCIITPLFFSRI